jgi:phosphodiesterase/alkaline phosphatase D-like protein
MAFARQDGTLRLPSPYYTYTAGPVQFFVINTPLVSEAQLQWLREELAASTSRWRVVYGHFQMYSALRGDNQALISRVLPILQEHRVHMYLCGHEHLFQHLRPEGGVEFFVNGAAGGSGRVARQQGYDRVLFMAEREQGFTVLEADAETMTVRFVGDGGRTLYEKSFGRER